METNTDDDDVEREGENLLWNFMEEVEHMDAEEGVERMKDATVRLKRRGM